MNLAAACGRLPGGESHAANKNSSNANILKHLL
jgi:hypothetical protein